MGFFITFLAVYIHIFDKEILNISILEGNLKLIINLKVIMSIFIISIPLIVGIANIMLANNICDMEDDFINRRFTLPIYIGKENALNIFKYLYYIGFVGIIIGVILKVLPITSLLVLLVFIPINKNIKLFYTVQSKKDTFVLAVKNFVLLNVTYIFTILLGILF